MSRAIRWYDYITINIFFLGLTTISQTVTPLVFPLLVQQFVGESGQGAFFGNLRLWTLMVALLVQALMGMLSDHSRSRWGRRRPFIFIGTILDVIIISAIAGTSTLQGESGYWVLFSLALLLSVASNTAHGPVQGLIPDLVPEKSRGVFSGIKAIMEVPLPVILVAFTIGPMIGRGNLWGGILVLIGVLLTVMLLTMLVPEKALEGPIEPIDWQPFIRLILMTACFTAVILGSGLLVRSVEAMLAADTAVNTALVVLGGAGIVAISLAVGIGVLLSTWLSIGAEAASNNPAFSWWIVNRLYYLVGSTNLASFAVFFLQGKLGLAREQAAGPASQMLLFVGVFILVTALPSGWLADRFGHKPLVALSGLVAALGTLITILAPNLTIIYVGAVLIGVATGLFYTTNWALGTGLVPKEEAGRFLGISNLAGAGAGAVGAYIGGPIADYFTVHYPDMTGLGYVLLFAIYGVMFLFSIGALLMVRTTK